MINFLKINKPVYKVGDRRYKQKTVLFKPIYIDGSGVRFSFVKYTEELFRVGSKKMWLPIGYGNLVNSGKKFYIDRKAKRPMVVHQSDADVTPDFPLIGYTK